MKAFPGTTRDSGLMKGLINKTKTTTAGCRSDERTQLAVCSNVTHLSLSHVGVEPERIRFWHWPRVGLNAG